MYDEQVGPVGTESIKSLVVNGTLTMDDYVWNENIGNDSIPIAEIAELNSSKIKSVNNQRSHEEADRNDSVDESISTEKYSVAQVTHHINVRLVEGTSKNKILRELSKMECQKRWGFSSLKKSTEHGIRNTEARVYFIYL